MRNRKQTAPQKFGASSPQSPSKNGRPDVNSNKWRTVEIPRENIIDLVASHLYAMRGLTKKEITEIEIPDLLNEEFIQVKIKLKEEKPSRPVRPKKDNVEMA